MIRRKEILTTGEVARICHVAPRTVSKWFDSGKLRGYRIPGSRDRRIPLRHLLQFMRDHGMPVKDLEGNTIRILIVDPDETTAAVVADGLAESDRYEVRTAANDFEAGMLAGKFEPHVMLVEVVAKAVDATEILSNLRSNPNLAATKVIAVAGALTSGQRQRLLRDGFDIVLSKPYRIEDVARVIEDATDLIA
jgi:excisionase family DNA binding protein